MLEEHFYTMNAALVVSSKSRCPADMARAIGVAPTRVVDLDPLSVCAIQHVCWFVGPEVSLSDPAAALDELVERWRPLLPTLLQLDDCDKMLALWIRAGEDLNNAPPFYLDISASAIRFASELGATIQIGYTS